jgi:hypothetical protein
MREIIDKWTPQLSAMYEDRGRAGGLEHVERRPT